MARAIEPKLKLIDLYHKWREAQTVLMTSAGKMSVTPKMIRDERETYTIFYEALKKCNC